MLIRLDVLIGAAMDEVLVFGGGDVLIVGGVLWLAVSYTMGLMIDEGG